MPGRLKQFAFLTSALLGFLLLPQTSLAATLFLSPASGSFPVGATFKVGVRTNTAGQAANTAESTVTYDSNVIEIVSVAPGSTFTLQTPGSPSKSGGTAFFSAGIPTPGYNGSSGSLGVITFRAKAEGTASVSVSSGKVLLNDGNGTDALSGTSGGNYTITAPAVGAPAGEPLPQLAGVS